nr:DUF4837 family protein [Flavobacterium sp. SM15]
MFSCKENTKKAGLVLPASAGKINSVAIIIDDVLWNGEIGDTLRKKLAAPVDGLQDEEPLFTINQYSPKIFDASVQLNRNIVVVSKANSNEFKHVENKYASPQNVFYITGHSLKQLIETIELHSQTLASSIKFYEIIENQRQMSASLFNDKRIRATFGCTLLIPSSFSYALLDKKFLWLKKDIPSGNSSLLIYEVPISSLEKQNGYVSNLVRIRDSIGRRYIKGMVDKASMITEESYAPYLSKTKIDDKKSFEVRGTWELENSFMNGPFINYAIKDQKRNRYVVVEGFVYNPSSTKRDMIFELESIIKSLQFVNSKTNGTKIRNKAL